MLFTTNNVFQKQVFKLSHHHYAIAKQQLQLSFTSCKLFFAQHSSGTTIQEGNHLFNAMSSNLKSSSVSSCKLDHMRIYLSCAIIDWLEMKRVENFSDLSSFSEMEWSFVLKKWNGVIKYPHLNAIFNIISNQMKSIDDIQQINNDLSFWLEYKKTRYMRNKAKITTEWKHLPT